MIASRCRDEGDRNECDEVFLRTLEDGVQPPVAAQPGKGPFNHPADAGRDEPSVAAAGKCLDGDPETLAGLGQALAAVAEIAERWALEATLNEARSTGTMPLVSCRFAGETSIASGMPICPPRHGF